MARRAVELHSVIASDDIAMLDDEVLWCRTERHQWQWQRDQIADIENDKAFDRTSVCRKCGAEKTRTISITTFRVLGKPRMKYPKGYLIKGRGRIDMADVYRTQYQRRRPTR